MDFVKLVTCQIDILELLKVVSSSSCGATSVFIGNTRDHFNGRTVDKLVYEAYEPMAEKALLKVCADIREKWTVHGIAIHHRLGEVPVEESSVAIAISSVHRAESLQAVQFAIDELKAHVPIWKKEVYEGDFPAEWKANQECLWTKSDNDSREVLSTENENLVSYGDNVSDAISPDLVQIKVGGNEVKRRIESFVELKRKQVNTSNVLDFCANQDSEYSCARVDAILVRQKDSKGHLRVHRVENITGPQIQVPTTIQSVTHNLLNSKQEDVSCLNKMQPQFSTHQGIEERLQNVEAHLGASQITNQPIPKDIYTRLKLLEDRILQLEGLSPEYAQFWAGQLKRENDQDLNPKPFTKRVFSAADIEKKLQEFMDD